MHFIGSAPLESLSLWERWHCEAMTERASPARKSRCAAMGRLFVSAKRALHLCFPASGLTLSGASRQLSQRESLWQAGQVSSGRAKLICFVDCSALLSRPAALPSQALRASSPKGRALGRPVKFPLDAQSLFVSWPVVPCCLGQQQLDKVRCPEAAALCSKARPFAPYCASGVQ